MTKEVKESLKERERKREREFAYLDDDGGWDGLHCMKGKRLTLFVVEKVKEQS